MPHGPVDFFLPAKVLPVSVTAHGLPYSPPDAPAASRMISVYDYAIIVIYLGFLASMGWVFRRFNHGSKDYFAGGFRMTWWLLGASSFMSNFSAWLFTGAANIAYTYGILIFGFYAIDVLGFLLSYLWFAERFRQLRLVTAVDGLRLRFGRANEQFFTWLWFINSLGLAAVWMVSLSIILSSTFQFPPGEVIAVTGAVVVFIALLGGNWAVAASDFIQLLVLLSVTVVVAVLTVVKIGGVGKLLAQIPPDHWQMFHPAGRIPYDWIYLATGLLSATYMKNNVIYAAKYIGAKDSGHARRSALVPLIGYSVMPIIWFIPPLAAFTLVPNLAAHTSARIPGEAAYILVALKVLPRGLIGLMIGGMFSATIASMDVALNKNAGFFVKNVYQVLLRPRASDRELVFAGELSTVAFGVLITGLALAMVLVSHVSLFDAFLYMGAYLGVPLAIPMFLGMFVRGVPAWSGWATTLVGMTLTAFFYLYVPTAAGAAALRPWLGGKVYSYLITNKFVITNLIGVPITAAFFYLTKLAYRPVAGSPYERDTDEFFRRLRTPVDFEREVGADNTADQARVLGTMACLYGGFISCLLLIPNPWLGRTGILACGLLLLGVGLGLRAYARRLRRELRLRCT
jgi:SSS family solute:Na+ symporter